MKVRSVVLFLALALAVGFAVPASAATIVLTFEGLQNSEPILDFYNGGLGGMGSGPGPAYGIVFGADSLALIDADNGGGGNFANEPSPSTVAYFLSGPGVIMNVPGGFTTGFSFFYSANSVGSVTVYDGLDGTGNLLATLPLALNWQNGGCVGDPTGLYCNWDPIGVAFGGTALSVNFSGGANFIAFDDVTLGSTTPGAVPEPGSLLLLGTGLVGLGRAWRKRRG